MKIKTKLLFIVGFSALAIIILSAFLYRSFQSFGQAIGEIRIINQINTGVFEKNLLLNEYLLYHEDRQREQWLKKNDSLALFIKSQLTPQSVVFNEDSEKEIINNLLNGFEADQKIFLELVTVQATNSGEIKKEQEVGLSAQISIKAQETISETQKLLAISTKDANLAQKTISYFLVGMISAIFSVSLIATLLLWKSLVGPITKLQKGAKIIGEGNLEYKVEVESKDEIGQLALAFNQMTENLKKRAKELSETKSGMEVEVKKRTEERYGNLFKASTDAIMTLEPPSWKFTSGNPATIKMFRAKDEAEFLSYEPWKLSPEKQPDGKPSGEKAKEMIEKAMKEGTNLFEWTHKRIDGEEFLAEVLLSKVGHEETAYLLATVRDITERKKAQDSLEKANQIMVGRELEMMKLKQRIKELEEVKHDGNK